MAKFIFDLKPETTLDNSDSLYPEDQEIIKKLEEIEKEVKKHFDAFELHLAFDKIYNFVWHEFADIYIEQSKKRRPEAQPCLEEVLKKCIVLISPFMPDVANDIMKTWQR